MYLSFSEFETIFFPPFFHDLYEILHLWIACILQHIDNLNEALLILHPGHDKLEDANGGAALPLPKLRIRIQPLQHIERLG